MGKLYFLNGLPIDTETCIEMNTFLYSHITRI